MEKLNKLFTKFMSAMLKIILFIIILASICILFPMLIYSNKGTIVFTMVMILSFLIGYKTINSKINHKQKVIILLSISLFVRILWLLNAQSTPSSDFKVMYESARAFIDGNSSSFKGIGYIARFPHLTMTVLYMSVNEYLFPNYNLLSMKMINLFLGVSVLILLYLIVSQLFESKEKSLLALLIGSVFPPFITYTSVYCSENLAMPFYLMSIYLFIKAIKVHKNKALLFCFSSIFLAIGNLFRMVAIVILIAYFAYILFYYKDKIFKKFTNILLVVVPYFLIIVSVSNILQKANITENQLWRGSEPKITNVLKGTNFNSLGMWNVEDAKIVEENLDDYNKLKLKCNEIIYNRFINISFPRLFIFYIVKMASEWCIGDFGGSLWSQKDLDEEKIIFKIGILGSVPFQIFYIVILMLALTGLKKKNIIEADSKLNLFYLIFLGYVAAYLITENQIRYGYIISWVFIILAVYGINDKLEVESTNQYKNSLICNLNQ